MKKIDILKYENARFTKIGHMDIVCEFEDFTDCVSQTIIPFRVTFSKEKHAWVHKSLPEKDFSPFEDGSPVANHLQPTLFDVAAEFEKRFADNNDESEVVEIEKIINF